MTFFGGNQYPVNLASAVAQTAKLDGHLSTRRGRIARRSEKAPPKPEEITAFNPVVDGTPRSSLQEAFAADYIPDLFEPDDENTPPRNAVGYTAEIRRDGTFVGSWVDGSDPRLEHGYA